MKRFVVLFLALIMVFSFVACGTAKDDSSTKAPSADSETLQFKFYAVDLDGNKSEFTVDFEDGQTVGDALIADELIAGEQGDYGLYVKTVNGITLDYDTDGAYWAFCIGEDMAATGVDDTKATAGAEYSFVATKG